MQRNVKNKEFDSTYKNEICETSIFQTQKKKYIKFVNCFIRGGNF